MNANFQLICPHCGEGQMKQNIITELSNHWRAGQIFTCRATDTRGCGKDFAVYYRTEVTAKAVAITV